MPADEWMAEALAKLESDSLRRRLRTTDSACRPMIDLLATPGDCAFGPGQPADCSALPPASESSASAAVAGGAHLRHVLQFASNDYLGLAADSRLATAAAEAARTYGVGSGASGLITGHHLLLDRLEQELAGLKSAEAAIVLPTGYMANLAAIGTLVGPGDLVLADRLCHASMIDGARLSGARLARWHHNDLASLSRKLAARGGYRRRLVMTESIFSMDGDAAPLADLAELCRQASAMLLVDEAHATGLYGSSGAGLAQAHGLPASAITATVGTLSKALGGQGGFISGRQNLVDLVANRGRTLIYSTAMSPAQAGAALAALEVIKSEPERRNRVLEMSVLLRKEIALLGLKTIAGDSPIVPVIVGDAAKVVEASERLLAEGILVPAIRPPTVPRGGSRLRISLTASHTLDQIQQLLDALPRALG